ncbi:hypothetical protein AOLI_G00306470 [Acnodon oligacanthus]
MMEFRAVGVGAFADRCIPCTSSCASFIPRPILLALSSHPQPSPQNILLKTASTSSTLHCFEKDSNPMVGTMASPSGSGILGRTAPARTAPSDTEPPHSTPLPQGVHLTFEDMQAQ